MFMLDGISLPIDTAFTANGIQYPANWLRLATPEEKQALGITEVTEQSRPDDRYYWVTDNGNGTYTSAPKELAPLKELHVSQVKAAAGSLLAPTDWEVIKAVELGLTITAELHATRNAIRTRSDELEADIAACTTVAELAALEFTWPE